MRKWKKKTMRKRRRKLRENEENQETNSVKFTIKQIPAAHQTSSRVRNTTILWNHVINHENIN